MVKLEPYSPVYLDATVSRISGFFGFHQALLCEASSVKTVPATQHEESRTTLASWLEHPSALFVLLLDDASVGFLRLCYRGPNVAWIEDVYVDPEFRGRGIATCAIGLAEKRIMETPGYSAVSLDVSPRNADALRLYHRLGYTGISILTLRKELGENRRDKPLPMLGLDFTY